MWKTSSFRNLPAEVSMSPNRTTKWIVGLYKSGGTGEVLSAVEAGSVARLCS